MNRLVTGAYEHSLLLHLMRRSFSTGFLLVDPTGDLALALADTIPQSLIQRTFLFEPADNLHRAAYNIFNGVARTGHHTIASQFCAVFDAIFPEGATTLTRMNASFILQLSLRVLLEKPDATLLELIRIIREPDYRNRVLSHTKDPEVRAGWAYVDERSSKDKQYYPNAVAPLIAKLGGLMLSPELRAVLGHPHSTFSLSREKIVIANLDRRALGDLNAKLLGLLLVTLARCPVYINQAEFFATDYLATLFPRGGFTVATRILPNGNRYPDLREALLGLEEHIVFRTTRRDAEALGAMVGNPNVLVDLQPGHFQTVGGEQRVPEIPRCGHLKAIRKRSWARHTRPNARRR